MNRRHRHDTQYLSIREVERWAWPDRTLMTPAIVLLHQRPLSEIQLCQLLRTCVTPISKKSTVHK